MAERIEVHSTYRRSTFQAPARRSPSARAANSQRTARSLRRRGTCTRPRCRARASNNCSPSFRHTEWRSDRGQGHSRRSRSRHKMGMRRAPGQPGCWSGPGPSRRWPRRSRPASASSDGRSLASAGSLLESFLTSLQAPADPPEPEPIHPTMPRLGAVILVRAGAVTWSRPRDSLPGTSPCRPGPGRVGPGHRTARPGVVGAGCRVFLPGYGWTGQRKSASGVRVTVTSPAASAANTASSEVSR